MDPRSALVANVKFFVAQARPELLAAAQTIQQETKKRRCFNICVLKRIIKLFNWGGPLLLAPGSRVVRDGLVNLVYRVRRTETMQRDVFDFFDNDKNGLVDVDELQSAV